MQDKIEETEDIREELLYRFISVYEKYKMNFYKNIFAWMDNKKTALTPVETITAEVINILNEPTVNDLAQFLRVSHPNIAYKINSLVKKGYVEKIQSQEDKREFLLKLTPKFYSYYENKNEHTIESVQNFSDGLTDEEVLVTNKMLEKLDQKILFELDQGDE